MKERLDKKCIGCKFDGTDDGAYFCLSCILIGKFNPHIKKSRPPKKYSETELLERRKEDHNAITNKENKNG